MLVLVHRLPQRIKFKLRTKVEDGLKVTQGAGDGTMFGTDATNNGGLLATETVRNNLNAAWSGDNLVVTNTAGGKVAVRVYAAI